MSTEPHLSLRVSISGHWIPHSSHFRNRPPRRSNITLEYISMSSPVDFSLLCPLRFLQTQPRILHRLYRNWDEIGLFVLRNNQNIYTQMVFKTVFFFPFQFYWLDRVRSQ